MATSTPTSNNNNNFYSSINNNYLKEPHKLIRMSLTSLAISLAPPLDAACFYAEHNWIYLKCKLPFSALKQHSQPQHHRILRVTATSRSNLTAETSVHVLFSVDESVHRLEEALVSVTHVNCSSDLHRDPLRDKPKDLDLIINDQVKFSSTPLPVSVHVRHHFVNETRVKLVCNLNVSSPRLESNTRLWHIELANHSGADLCLFRLHNENDSNTGLFRVDTNGFLSLRVAWTFPWWSSYSSHHSLRLEAYECLKLEPRRLLLDVELEITWKNAAYSLSSLSLSELPRPGLVNSDYELHVVNRRGVRRTQDLLLLDGFELMLFEPGSDRWPVLACQQRLFNATFSLVKEHNDDDELPFFLDPYKGQLFYVDAKRSQQRRLASPYELRVHAHLHFVHNESLAFKLRANVRVNIWEEQEDGEETHLSSYSRITAPTTPYTRSFHATLDLSMESTDADLRELLRCPLLAQFRSLDYNSKRPIYKLVMPVLATSGNGKRKTMAKVPRKSSVPASYKSIFKYSSKTKKQTRNRRRVLVILNINFYILKTKVS